MPEALAPRARATAPATAAAAAGTNPGPASGATASPAGTTIAPPPERPAGTGGAGTPPAEQPRTAKPPPGTVVETATPVMPPPSSSSAAQTLSRELAKYQAQARAAVPAPEKEEAWLCGTLPECPRQNLDLAGVGFPRTSEKVVVRETEEGWKTDRYPSNGVVNRITPSKRDEVFRAIARRVVRPGPNKGTIYCVDDPNRRYRPQRGDRPLAEFIYMERHPEMDGEQPPEYPKSLAESMAAPK